MRPLLLPVVALLVLVLSACQGDDRPAATPGTPSTPMSTTASTAAPVEPPPRPRAGRCHRMSYAEVLAPTTTLGETSCRRRHTTYTFHVGTLDTVVDGHLLAVDSARVRAQVARECPRRFARFVGGTADARRLSMLRAVWFSPTVEASDAGQSWFRCDVVAIATVGRLAPLGADLKGVLERPAARQRYGVCGTARPGAKGFRRVICSRRHSWRAVEVVEVRAAADGAYPGARRAREAGEDRCRSVGRAASDDSLNFSWGWEWPSREQWAEDQRHGLCWVPD